MRTLAATAAFAVSLTSLVTRPAVAADILLGAAVGSRVKVQIKKTSSNPAAHKIQYSAKHPGVVFTPGGGATDDPPTNGAAAVIFSATDCQCLTRAAAPTMSPGWTPSPASGTPQKYKWKDNVTRSTAQVSAGKIKLKKKDGITYGLDAAPQGDVEVQITFGDSADTFCTRFASGGLNNDTATKYQSSSFPAFAACSPVPGICPCAPPPTSTSTTSTTTTPTPTTTTTTIPFCGQFLTKWGSSGTGDGQFATPRGVAVDGSGNVFVTESGPNCRVQKFTNTGAFVTKWNFPCPTGVAVHGSGDVFVGDDVPDTVRRHTNSGTFLMSWGGLGSGNGQFNTPWGVAVDASGNVFVGDRQNNRIQKFACP